MAWNGTERRAAKRYGVRNSAVRYSKGGLLGLIAGKSARFLILNMCEGGMHFICPQELQVGAALSLEMTAPVVDTPFKASAVITWRLPASLKDAWRIGVRFTNVSKTDMQKLKHAINSSVQERIDITTTYYFIESNKL